MSDVQQATRSRLVDELLQLVGLDAEAPPNPGSQPRPAEVRREGRSAPAAASDRV